jgi:hypothetical protein
MADGPRRGRSANGAERASRAGRTRRRVLLGAGAGVAASLAGCLDVVTGSEPLTFSARAATVAESTLSETDYSHRETRRPVAERTFEAAGQSRTVEVTNVVASYEKGVEIPTVGSVRAAVFAALSTPKVEILGRSFNPVADMTTEEIARRVQRRYDTVRDLRERGTFSIDVLGETTTVTRFAGTAALTSRGLEVDVTLLVSEPVPADGDFVVCFGAYPQLLDERDAQETLMRGVEHDG